MVNFKEGLYPIKYPVTKIKKKHFTFTVLTKRKKKCCFC